MKIYLLSTYLAALLVSSSSVWELQIRGQDAQTITGTGPTKGCKTIYIPRGDSISWSGINGARTLQIFNTQGKCTQVYRTVMGEGEINASNNIYGYMVKA
ncbi:hypothetical protein N7490_007686 [Penicillium lividum]|nr:hypothetical protein N7490_007686 [Penicillium lividum]